MNAVCAWLGAATPSTFHHRIASRIRCSDPPIAASPLPPAGGRGLEGGGSRSCAAAGADVGAKSIESDGFAFRLLAWSLR